MGTTRDPRRWLAACLTALLLAIFAQGARADRLEPPPPPTTAVIFGGTGDLAKRKVFPSLLASWKSGQLPRDFRVVAAARDGLSRDAYLAQLREGMRTIAGTDLSDPAWKELEARIDYQQVDLTDAGSVRALGRRLDELDKVDRGRTPRQRMLYLAVTPSVLESAATNLGEAGLLSADHPGGPPLLLVEKPFGRDLRSAQRINKILAGRISPDRVMRMDHYLGKPAIDDLRQLRRKDPALERVWNRGYIARVEISASEKIGIEGRGQFYEETGALRDFVQGHLVQELAVTAMDPVGGVEGREAKTRVVRALRPLDPRRDVVRSQYQGYRDEPGVAPGSEVETYVAVTAHIDSARWQGVPFLLESGKGLDQKRSAIRVHFRRLSPELAERYGVPADKPAVLEVEIDPAPRISLTSEGRRIPIADRRSGDRPDPYERLLVAAMRGEHALFVGDREVEGAWEWLRPVQKAWREHLAPITTYPRGSARPAAAARLFHRFAPRRAKPARVSTHLTPQRFGMREQSGLRARDATRTATMRRHALRPRPRLKTTTLRQPTRARRTR